MSGLALGLKQSPSRSSREHVSSGTTRSRTLPRFGSIGSPLECSATSCFSHSRRVRALTGPTRPENLWPARVDTVEAVAYCVWSFSRLHLQGGVHCGRGNGNGIESWCDALYLFPRDDMAASLDCAVWLNAVGWHTGRGGWCVHCGRRLAPTRGPCGRKPGLASRGKWGNEHPGRSALHRR